MSYDEDYSRKPVTGRHVAVRDWVRFFGAETIEERLDRLFRERTEDALVASADATDAATLAADAEDRRYRETHPTQPSEASLEIARKYIAKVDAEGG